jgi:hypothetical protein
LCKQIRFERNLKHLLRRHKFLVEQDCKLVFSFCSSLNFIQYMIDKLCEEIFIFYSKKWIRNFQKTSKCLNNKDRELKYLIFKEIFSKSWKIVQFLCLVIRLTAINEFHYKCWRASQSKNVKRSRFTLLFFQQDEYNFFFSFLIFYSTPTQKTFVEREKKDDENKNAKYGHELFNKFFLFVFTMIFVSNKIFNIVFIFYDVTEDMWIE